MRPAFAGLLLGGVFALLLDVPALPFIAAGGLNGLGYY